MELIIGGAFQGKSDYAKKQHPEIDVEGMDNNMLNQAIKDNGIVCPNCGKSSFKVFTL